jgi:diguanylate cyclase (GGDEF)-like protein
MKRLIFLFAMVLGGAWASWAAPPVPLTTLQAIHALSNAEADRGLPVAFEATVTYFNGSIYALFVQDDGLGIYVGPKPDYKLVPGDRILIRGKTQGSFRPIVLSDSVSLVRHGDLPKPVPATFDELIRGQYDSTLVTVHGVVRAADKNADPTRGTAFLQILTEGGYVHAELKGSDANALKGLLDAEVEVTGVAGGEFDGKVQMWGVSLSVSSPADVKILKHASASPWSLPRTPLDQVITRTHVTDSTQRISVHGTITYYQPGTSVVLQDGNKSLWIETQTVDPLRIGDVVDATGFPAANNGFLTLTGGEIQESPVYAPIAPLQVTLNDLTWSKHIYDLVSIEGQVVMEVRESSQDEYVLVSGGQVFSAIYRHPPAGPVGSPIAIPPMNQVPIGSGVRIAGISIVERSNPYRNDVPFNILMRTPDDISVVTRPSLLTVRNLMIVVGVLLLAVLIVGARGWAIERRVRRQTTALAMIEQRRSRILEDINGTLPLAEIIEEITELVSFKLRGAPCWCQVADGAQLGNCPPKLEGLRVVRTEIPAHTGPALGALFVAFDPLAKPRNNEAEALSKAVALAALAIETRRVYSDLMHRSEFDLLTDIHNRFSLDKYLDLQIAEARQKAGIFGLIYIDLDKFKQINDIYGHQIGDLYLQEVALRMKRQLRGVDMLARLGGDEFAVLLPRVRNRAKVEEIAQRLDRSFEEPFIIEGQTLHGAASVGIALYPEDGATKDDLLSAADAAMYAVKRSKRQVEDSLAQNL